jgi:hypothetical protein
MPYPRQLTLRRRRLHQTYWFRLRRLRYSRIMLPGTWIDSDPADAHESSILVRELSNQTDADVALDMFEGARSQLRLAQQERKAALRARIDAMHRGEFGTRPSEPRRRLQRKTLLCASLFLYALAHFKEALNKLAKRAGGPPSLTSIHSRYRCVLFPGLKGVRATRLSIAMSA